MNKKVPIGTKPTAAKAAATPTADAWVDDRANGDEQEAMKRLTIDVPESLHRTIKTQCAMRGTKIADEVRELLIKKYMNQ